MFKRNKVAQFYRVPFMQYYEDTIKVVTYRANGEELPLGFYPDSYGNVATPRRASWGSAGYDFFAPFTFQITEEYPRITIPTGIRCKIKDGWTLLLFPRSGLGFKYQLNLVNGTGVIDSDYFATNNDGHIMARLHVPPDVLKEHGPVTVEGGQAFMQGVFVPFGVARYDSPGGVRVGGLGSTDFYRQSRNKANPIVGVAKKKEEGSLLDELKKDGVV